MALCVIGFDGYFLNNPTQCFFSNTCTSDEFFDSTELYNTDTLYSIKVPLIKGQLAAGVLMFVSSMIYIIIFVITNYRVSKGPSAPVASYANPPVTSSYNPPVETYTASTAPNNEIICHNCSSKFQIATQHEQQLIMDRF